jgi:molybdopterin-containing oxidoreductase family iron-sulfur binding subunit
MSDSPNSTPLDLAALRERLASERGPRFWRSLAEIAETPAFDDLLRHEFPAGADVWEGDAAGRRNFLKLMGASLALAGLAGCTKQPEERILPFARTPEETIPGTPLYFASAVTLGGYADGVLVESHMGRPTKIEGNPEHPASLGATNSFGQAAVLSLYDPDRSQVVTNVGRISSWLAFVGELTRQLEAQKLKGGAGIRVLTETVTSPSLGDELRRLSEQYPGARWHQYDPCGRDAVREGARRALGEYAETYYRLERAQVIVALGGDLCVMISELCARRRARSDVKAWPGCVGANSTNRMDKTQLIMPVQVRPTCRHRLLGADKVGGEDSLVPATCQLHEKSACWKSTIGRSHHSRGWIERLNLRSGCK